MEDEDDLPEEAVLRVFQRPGNLFLYEEQRDVDQELVDVVGSGDADVLSRKADRQVREALCEVLGPKGRRAAARNVACGTVTGAGAGTARRCHVHKD